MLNENLLRKWLNGTISEAELAELRREDDFILIEKFDKSLETLKAPEYDVEQALVELTEKKSTKGKVIKLFAPGTMLKIAASIILVMVGYFLLMSPSELIVKTEVAEKTNIRLPDETEVHLNALSSVSYIEKNWPDNRQLELAGEAFFKVSKGSTFDVNTSHGKVSVIGTQFNVKSREMIFEVNCFEGHVAVIINADTVNLLANQGYRIVGARAELLSIDGNQPSWTKNESSFDSVPYAEVVLELERQYAVEIELRGVEKNRSFTGTFPHNDLEIALRSIALPFNLEIEYSSKTNIVLSADQK